ncbi:DUF2461 domain-containing protein [Pontibacter akesuensis]|uniref:TIGR02453 family protein n=1 Tax=Pontibacter akesuensis TaxID=388950 RepID=A0A1I7JWW6_9BACT|nr:DUF2461 domain-containing protein [Pontibacter akesuensis]GHA76989.1 TIGR02453 family protein [Pontibacter akesuensis]SFU89674.1 TIGR02453 family protein [Pontibacter akesuensis]
MSIAFILHFLEQLRENNSKDWMDAHREEYLQAKAYFVEIVAQLIGELQQFDPSLIGVTPQQCIFRINKNDFSKKGEAPYKGHFGAGISQGGRHSPFANYVLLLEPGNNSRIGGGIRQPGTRQLELIREEIDYNPGTLQQLLGEPEFGHLWGKLRATQRKQPPKGYDKTHPELDLLKYNGFQVLRYYTDTEVQAEGFLSSLPPLYRQVKPLHDFLNTALTDL